MCCESDWGDHLKLQAEFGARSSGPEQIHGTAIVVVLLTLGPSLADKERRKAAFRHGMVVYGCVRPCSVCNRIYARVTPLSHAYDGVGRC
ncbi:hypothetical protein HZ326_4129 [Fusarium oxysporum f. sp. albedinis]|nr:hypothetical protein HZ326_4129 [Fusarium oxysporum f. sp. albedinis]